MADMTTTLYTTMNSAFCGVINNALINASGIMNVYTINCATQFTGTYPISYNASGTSYLNVAVRLEFNGDWTQSNALTGVNTTLSPTTLSATFSSGKLVTQTPTYQTA